MSPVVCDQPRLGAQSHPKLPLRSAKGRAAEVPTELWGAQLPASGPGCETKTLNREEGSRESDQESFSGEGVPNSTRTRRLTSGDFWGAPGLVERAKRALETLLGSLSSRGSFLSATLSIGSEEREGPDYPRGRGEQDPRLLPLQDNTSPKQPAMPLSTLPGNLHRKSSYPDFLFFSLLSFSPFLEADQSCPIFLWKLPTN